MKRIILLILIMVMLTGCSVVKLNSDNNDYNKIVMTAIKSDLEVNRASSGYKYFLPKGARLISDNDFNQKIKAYDTYIYLYVDVVSFYNKISLNNKCDINSYYHQKIINGNKKGTLCINKENDKYFVKMNYNYANIELYTDKENLNDVLAISSSIVGSVKYNKKMIKILLEDKSVSSSEVVYKLDKPSDAESNFSSYLKEYAQEEESEELPDLE